MFSQHISNLIAKIGGNSLCTLNDCIVDSIATWQTLGKSSVFSRFLYDSWPTVVSAQGIANSKTIDNWKQIQCNFFYFPNHFQLYLHQYLPSIDKFIFTGVYRKEEKGDKGGGLYDENIINRHECPSLTEYFQLVGIEGTVLRSCMIRINEFDVYW